MIETTHRCDGRALHVLLSAPKANILDAKMMAAIIDGLERELRPETCLIVFEGAGDHFSFGASVEEHTKERVASMLSSFHDLFRRLAEFSVPTCAVVRGQCLGGGLEFASWCSWIIATPDARLGQAEIQLAVFPPMASILLPWRCGGAAGMDLCLSGRSLKADEALSMGLINAITDDPASWWEELVERRLSRTSASSLRFAERALRVDLMRQLETNLPKLERLYIDELMETNDANEGINAFIERRKPTFIHS